VNERDLVRIMNLRKRLWSKLSDRASDDEVRALIEELNAATDKALAAPGGGR